MKLYADLHLHSRFSRATSENLNLKNLEKYALIKGLGLLGTGDITHPKWLQEIKAETEEKEGFYYTKTGFPFVLQGEISLIYKQDGKGRRVHHIILIPNIETAEQVQQRLLKIGRIDYDGRPIFSCNSIEFVEMMKEISDDIEIIPAHIWTPWFSLFGSMSGFDSIKDCFKDQLNHIYALETGLSADPPMCERLSQLDKFNLVSNSDSHSFWPWRIGRECNVLDIKLSYKNLIRAIRHKEGWLGTIEVDPSYGKYHFDGHRACNFHCSPKLAKKYNNICPKCKRPMTLGVLHRVEELADREENKIPHIHKYQSILPLAELLALHYGKKIESVYVRQRYDEMIKDFRDEMNILLDATEEEMEKKFEDKKIIKLIMANRTGEIQVVPGYDGEYGKPILGDKTVTLKGQAD